MHRHRRHQIAGGAEGPAGAGQQRGGEAADGPLREPHAERPPAGERAAVELELGRDPVQRQRKAGGKLEGLALLDVGLARDQRRQAVVHEDPQRIVGNGGHARGPVIERNVHDLQTGRGAFRLGQPDMVVAGHRQPQASDPEPRHPARKRRRAQRRGQPGMEHRVVEPAAHQDRRHALGTAQHRPHHRHAHVDRVAAQRAHVVLRPHRGQLMCPGNDDRQARGAGERGDRGGRRAHRRNDQQHVEVFRPERAGDAVGVRILGPMSQRRHLEAGRGPEPVGRAGHMPRHEVAERGPDDRRIIGHHRADDGNPDRPGTMGERLSHRT